MRSPTPLGLEVPPKGQGLPARWQTTKAGPREVRMAWMDGAARQEAIRHAGVS